MTHRPPFRSILLLLAAGLLAGGCRDPETIQLDFTSHPVRFIIDHRGWPRPFWWPRLTEFAIATEEDGAIWQLQAPVDDGPLARNFVITYGEVPPGFMQVFPEKQDPPAPLRTGRRYFVAAAGPASVYRMVFSMPIGPRDLLSGGPPPASATEEPQPPQTAGDPPSR
jgi:hypothetical protein